MTDEYVRYGKVYFNLRLYKAMKAPLTKHHDIMRIIVSRCEIDLKNIKDSYHIVVAEPLSKAITVITTSLASQYLFYISIHLFYYL